MTAMRPCLGCVARKDCDIKRAVLKAMRGQNVTSATIKCDLPFTRDFPAGTRVRVMVWDHHGSFDTDGSVNAQMAPATIYGKSNKKRGKLLCRLDKPFFTADGKEVFWRAEYPKDLDKIDEPKAELCSCGHPFINGNCDDFSHLERGSDF